MADPIDPKNADKRTAARYITMGLLDEKAYERHVKGLPDATEKSAPVETVMDDFSDDEDEDLDDDSEAEGGEGAEG